MNQAVRQWVSAVSLLAVTACGGGGGSSTPAAGGATTSSPPNTQTGSAQCSLVERQNWALATLQEWYLFPDTLPASLSPAGYGTVNAYVDALTATARSQGKDRFFSYVTSIAEENAYYNSGSTAGFGFRIATDATTRRAVINEAFETGPAFAAGIDRGDEIVAIGASEGSLRAVSDIIAAEGTAGVTNALGPSTAGTTRVLRVSGPTGTRTLSVAKADYNLQPLSNRYGSKIIDDGGRRVGYINLRTFISTADNPLRAAFDGFRAQGVTDLVIDLRYNGGGLVSTAELIGDLLGRNRFASEIQNVQAYRPEKASRNVTRRFEPQAQSVAPTRVAFITTGASASASELVINSQIPYLGTNMALVGGNTFGKPVGQVAVDRSACDDRFRVIAFATQNSQGNANYFNGLAATVPVTCRAADDPARPLGDPSEASLRQALDFIAGRSCSAIAVGQGGQSAARSPQLLTPASPTAAQRDTPGLF